MSNVAIEPLSKSASITLLRELVEIETPSLNAAASEHIALKLEALFTTLGADVELLRTEAGTNLIIDVPGTGTPLLLVGHTDTVWPIGTLETTVPWIEGDGTIAGPGVFDMKSGIVVMLMALSRLSHGSTRATRIVLTCDEEVGSPTTTPLLRELAGNASAALGFESPHPDGALKVGRRGSTRVRIDVTGRAAHAALDPELGVSAIDELVDQLIRVRSITAHPDLATQVLSNVGTIAGGARANVVPSSAWAEIGMRFIDGHTEQQVLSALQALTPVRQGAVVATTVLSNRPAWRASPQDHALLEQVRQLAHNIGQSVDGRPADGAGDTNLLGSLGLPTLDGFGPRGAGAHATHEHMFVDSLIERADLLTAVLSPAREGDVES